MLVVQVFVLVKFAHDHLNNKEIVWKPEENGAISYRVPKIMSKLSPLRGIFTFSHVYLVLTTVKLEKKNKLIE